MSKKYRLIVYQMAPYKPILQESVFFRRKHFKLESSSRWLWLALFFFFAYILYTGDKHAGIANSYSFLVFGKPLSNESQQLLYITLSAVSLSSFLNSRALWVLVLASLQIYMLAEYSSQMNDYFLDFNDNYVKVIQSLIPVVMVSPIAFILWVFRNNDKRRELEQSEKDFLVKLKEIRNKEEELSVQKEKNRDDYNLKSRELDLKETEVNRIQ